MSPTEQNLEDAELVRAIRAGSSDSFDPLMARHEGVVFRFLVGKTGNRSEAEDILQQTFINAFQKLDRYKPEYPFASWVLAIARNLAATTYRREKSREAKREFIEIPDAPPTPHDHALTQEDAAEIWRLAREHLSEESHDALYLAYQEDWNMEQIARALKCKPGRVKVLLFRARKKLAPFLVEHFSEPISSPVSCQEPLYQGVPS